MKERYSLTGEAFPAIPVPHDCVIKSIDLDDRWLVFSFEDRISDRDSIQFYQPEAKSLIVRYHFAEGDHDFSLYQWVKPNRLLARLFSSDGHYKRLKNSALPALPKGKVPLAYLYHNVGFSSIIMKLFQRDQIILDARVDFIEYEWIC